MYSTILNSINAIVYIIMAMASQCPLDTLTQIRFGGETPTKFEQLYPEEEVQLEDAH